MRDGHLCYDGPYEGVLPVLGLPFRVSWLEHPARESLWQMVISVEHGGEVYYLQYRLEERMAEHGIAIELVSAAFGRAFLAGPATRAYWQGRTGTTEDRSAPDHAKPLAPLPEWLKGVGEVLEEAQGD